MPRFAKVEGGVVVGVFEYEKARAPRHLHEVSENTSVGFLFDGKSFVAPAPIVAPKEPRRIGSPREFLSLFTQPEKAAFFEAEIASGQLRQWWAEASVGDFSLDHPSVAPGLDALVAGQIITQARMDEILVTDFDNIS